MTRFVSALRRAPHLRITGERQRLLASFAAVFLFGLLAHGYAFTNFTVSHDSLNEMFLSGDIRYAAGSVADWKISLGRFLYPAYRAVFSGGAGTPWLSGVLSLVWVSLAVYLVSRLFSVDNALLLAVIGALFVTNVSYSALAATYIYDLDGDMLAMLLAVCAAYLLLRGTLRRRALAVIPIVGSLALYQAMISVTVSLVMIACILQLLESESAKAVFFDGLKAVGILFVGGAAYYILVRAVCGASDVALGGGYNSLLSLGRMTPALLPEAVRQDEDLSKIRARAEKIRRCAQQFVDIRQRKRGQKQNSRRARRQIAHNEHNMLPPGFLRRLIFCDGIDCVLFLHAASPMLLILYIISEKHGACLVFRKGNCLPRQNFHPLPRHGVRENEPCGTQLLREQSVGSGIRRRFRACILRVA